jgi:hypothetical protein
MKGLDSCKMASKLASDACERRLTFAEWLRMRLHMIMCASCRNCEKEIRLIHDTLKLIRRHPDGFAIDLPEKDRQLIRDALRRLANE